VCLAEFHVYREVVESECLFGVLEHLVRLGDEVIGDVGVEPVEIIPLDIQRPFLVWIFLGKLADFVAVVIAVELFELVNDFCVLCSSHIRWLHAGYIYTRSGREFLTSLLNDLKLPI
jgi:hypothetical protein